MGARITRATKGILVSSMAVAATAEVNPLLHSQKYNKAPKILGFRHQGDPRGSLSESRWCSPDAEGFRG